MIIEHALLNVIPGRELEFEAAMKEAIPIIESAPGCFGAEVRRQIEESSTYLLMVNWSSVEAHVEQFRESALFEQWKLLTHHFYVDRPTVTHFNQPLL